MASTNKHDFIGLLIGAGLVAVAGYGVYRILKGFSSFKPGEKVSDTALLAAASQDLGNEVPASGATGPKLIAKALE